MPLHCDSRSISNGSDIHGHIEGQWEDCIDNHYPIDAVNQRFLYDMRGFPLRDDNPSGAYANSALGRAETAIPIQNRRSQPP
jgi:hypothetical protein